MGVRIDRRAPSLDVRPVGALVATIVSMSIVVGGLVIEPSLGWLPGLVGMPIVVILARRMSPELVEASGAHVLAVALWFGARTILITDALAVGVMIGTTAVGGMGWLVDGHSLVEVPLYLVAGVVGTIALSGLYYFAGLAFVGLPISVIVFPAAVVWAIALRAITSKPRTGPA